MSLKEKERVQFLLKKHGVIIRDHIVFDDWKHGTSFVAMSGLYPHASDTSEMCGLLTKRFIAEDVDTVVSGDEQGHVLAHAVAVHLSNATERSVLAVCAERERVPIVDPEELGRPCYAETGRYRIRPQEEKHVRGKRVLVVYDTAKTGQTVSKLVAAVYRAAGAVAAVGLLCSRGDVGPAEVGHVRTYRELTSVPLDSCAEKNCIACKTHVPVNTEVGNGREYLARKAKEELQKQAETPKSAAVNEELFRQRVISSGSFGRS